MDTFSHGRGGLKRPPSGMGRMSPASQDLAESQVRSQKDIPRGARYSRPLTTSSLLLALLCFSPTEKGI